MLHSFDITDHYKLVRLRKRRRYCQSRCIDIDKQQRRPTRIHHRLTPTNPTIAVDTDIQFTATGIYSDNTTQDLTSTVTWTTSAVDSLNVASGTEVAQFAGFSSSSAAYSSSYHKPGYTQATRTGKAKIWGKWGNISGSTIVTVTSATLVSIAITPTNPSIVKGSNQQFVATGTFSDNTTQDVTTTVTWSSSDCGCGSASVMQQVPMDWPPQ